MAQRRSRTMPVSPRNATINMTQPADIMKHLGPVTRSVTEYPNGGHQTDDIANNRRYRTGK